MMKSPRVVPLLALLSTAACGPETEPPVTTGTGNARASLSSCTTTRQLQANPGFESGDTPDWWSSDQDIINDSGPHPAHSGTWKATLNGQGFTSWRDISTQLITLPAGACDARISLWLRVETDEPRPDYRDAFDYLSVSVVDGSWTMLDYLGTFTEHDATGQYEHYTFDLSAFRGQTIRVRFAGSEDNVYQTTFLLDDLEVLVTE
jgi:hypothetical protein